MSYASSSLFMYFFTQGNSSSIASRNIYFNFPTGLCMMEPYAFHCPGTDAFVQRTICFQQIEYQPRHLSNTWISDELAMMIVIWSFFLLTIKELMNVEQLIIRGSNPKTSNNTTYYIRISCIIKEMLLRSKIAYRIKWTLERIGVSTPVFWHRLTKETELHRQSVESKISTFRLTVWIGVFHRGRTHIINEWRFSCEKYGCAFHHREPSVFCMSW